MGVDQPHDPRLFRSFLLQGCQTTFEATATQSSLELEIQYKQRLLGTMGFIGRLICSEILASKLILVVCEGLLKPQASTGIAEGAKLECLVSFIRIIGPDFDREDWAYVKELRGFLAQLMDEVQMNHTSHENNRPQRVRFLVMNLLDERKSGWASQRKAKAKATAVLAAFSEAEKAAATTSAT